MPVIKRKIRINKMSTNTENFMKTAEHLFGLVWKCPYCKESNVHNFPDFKRDWNTMYGSIRRCDECFSEYSLGKHKSKEESNRDKVPT